MGKHMKPKNMEQVIDYLAKEFDLEGLTAWPQSEWIKRGELVMTDAAFVVVSQGLCDFLTEVTASQYNAIDKLGYWSECYDNNIVGFIPKSKKEAERVKATGRSLVAEILKPRQEDKRIALSLRKAKAKMSLVPVVDYPLGMHQYTWVRLRRPVNGETNHIIDSKPHYMNDLESALEQIRALPGITKAWYELD